MRHLALLILCVAGCEKPEWNMAEQPKHKPLQSSALFNDGASARPLLAGVVPRTAESVPGGAYVTAWQTIAPVATTLPASHTPQSGILPGAAQPRMPIPLTREVIDAGQVQFDIFCAVCHGRLGNGQGMIVQRGYSPPSSFHVDRLRDAPDGHLFDVITNGYGAMFGYGDRIPPSRRWEVVAYIRALQASSAASNLDLETQRRLIGQGDRPMRLSGGRQ